MKNLLHNPFFYYIGVPVLVCLWPLMVQMAFIPRVEDKLADEWKEYELSAQYMEEILKLDPGRLEAVQTSGDVVRFDYVAAIDQVARSCGIGSGNYVISAKPLRMSKKQKTQDATVVLKDIDITKFAKFLSEMQMRWGGLQCEKVKLSANAGVKDVWKVDCSFRYYY